MWILRESIKISWGPPNSYYEPVLRWAGVHRKESISDIFTTVEESGALGFRTFESGVELRKSTPVQQSKQTLTRCNLSPPEQEAILR